jgi:hypothetical protein
MGKMRPEMTETLDCRDRRGPNSSLIDARQNLSCLSPIRLGPIKKWYNRFFFRPFLISSSEKKRIAESPECYCY